jgi:hypothetical protein
MGRVAAERQRASSRKGSSEDLATVERLFGLGLHGDPEAAVAERGSRRPDGCVIVAEIGAHSIR